MKTIFLAIYKGVKFVLGGHGMRRFHLIKALEDFVREHIKSDSIIIHGHKMFLDSKDSLGLSIYGVYEENETEFINKEVKVGDIVLDIGANIGYHTLIFAKLVGENGKVFAFEPDPTSFDLLERNVRNNGYKNVVLINKAVAEKSGRLKLFLSEDNLADHRIYDSQDGRNFIEIESVRLDDYFKDFSGKINFIKMDIEGSEYGAVKGMFDLLKKTENVKIISEFWPFGLRRSGVEPAEYLEVLRTYGLSFYEFNEKEKKLDAVDVAKLLKTYTVEKENHTNLLCLN
ncbi:MAG: FkbM family methyltransferase [Candidatus Omnitrophica bacterium]|nr:FkbM family methyltransferase [Candidatus Omnitrophota bacterium]